MSETKTKNKNGVYDSVDVYNVPLTSDLDHKRNDYILSNITSLLASSQNSCRTEKWARPSGLFTFFVFWPRYTSQYTAL
jgi:hypothetical protein